jgi:hypothetical protein
VFFPYLKKPNSNWQKVPAEKAFQMQQQKGRTQSQPSKCKPTSLKSQGGKKQRAEASESDSASKSGHDKDGSEDELTSVIDICMAAKRWCSMTWSETSLEDDVQYTTNNEELEDVDVDEDRGSDDDIIMVEIEELIVH